MTWEEKTEMIKLHNSGKQKEMVAYFHERLSRADVQAWEMFFTSLELVSAQIEDDIEKHQAIVNHYETKTAVTFTPKSVRTMIRYECYRTIVSDLTKLLAAATNKSSIKKEITAAIDKINRFSPYDTQRTCTNAKMNDEIAASVIDILESRSIEFANYLISKMRTGQLTVISSGLYKCPLTITNDWEQVLVEDVYDEFLTEKSKPKS